MTLKSDHVISGVSLISAENKSLGVRSGGQKTLVWVPIDSIEKIIYMGQRKFAQKMVAGVLIGGVAGLLITMAITSENELED